jgi:hypothetical protein
MNETRSLCATFACLCVDSEHQMMNIPRRKVSKVTCVFSLGQQFLSTSMEREVRSRFQVK